MLYINYQISITFFDGHTEIEQESDQVLNVQEANQILKVLERDYILYNTSELWNRNHIFSINIFMAIDGERYFDQTINIVQLKYLIQWDKLELEKQRVDEFTQYRFSVIQKELKKQFHQTKTLTLDAFLTHKTEYLTDNSTKDLK